MLKDATGFKAVYIKAGYTDLRYGVNGLASLVLNDFNLNPMDEGAIFLFCGRRSDRIKALLWEGDGFLLLYKRLEQGRYQWPRKPEDVLKISEDQLHQLLSGFSIAQTIPPKEDPAPTYVA